MAMTKRNAEGARERAPQHIGFWPDGTLFRSDTPVQNEATRYVRRILGEVRSELLSPADVVYRLRTEPESIQRLFGPAVLGSWGVLSRFDQWPCAFVSSSLQAAVQSLGGPRPWLESGRDWNALCGQAAQRHGYTIPARDPSVTVHDLMGGSQ